MNPAAANSGAHTLSRSATSGASPSATACVSVWCSEWPGTCTTLIWLPRARGLSDHPRPGPFRRDDHADLRLIGSAAQPVGVDERAAPPVPENHALVGQLRERPRHGRPADPVPLAELVLGRKPLLRRRSGRRGSLRGGASSAGSRAGSVAGDRSPSLPRSGRQVPRLLHARGTGRRAEDYCHATVAIAPGRR